MRLATEEGACIDEKTAAAYVSGQGVDRKRQVEIERHTEACERCTGLIGEATERLLAIKLWARTP